LEAAPGIEPGYRALQSLAEGHKRPGQSGCGEGLSRGLGVSEARLNGAWRFLAVCDPVSGGVRVRFVAVTFASAPSG